MTELQKVKQQNSKLIQNNLELAAENETLRSKIYELQTYFERQKSFLDLA